jgi:2-polyprenyl-3-methyl-5-hydroxy-6-metoxy-1,4-benzoquinol methylase
MPIERKKRAVEIITIFKLSKHDPKRILDLGYGSGEITNYLQKRGYNITGLDISESNCEAAKTSYPDCDFRVYDGLKLPFEENFFDTVILNDVFEHIPYSHMDKLIENIKEVVEPGGIIYISATNRYELVEPHTLVPFLTWFPRRFWTIIDKKFNKTEGYHIDEIYPYTFRRLKKFCRIHNLIYNDFTYIYTLHKFTDLNYIGNRGLRLLAKFLNKLRLLRLFYYLAYRFSVILFVCKVKK